MVAKVSLEKVTTKGHRGTSVAMEIHILVVVIYYMTYVHLLNSSKYSPQKQTIRKAPQGISTVLRIHI